MGGGVLVPSTGGAFVPDPGGFPEPPPGRGVTASTVAAHTVRLSRSAIADFFGCFILCYFVLDRPAAWGGARFGFYKASLQHLTLRED